MLWTIKCKDLVHRLVNDGEVVEPRRQHEDEQSLTPTMFSQARSEVSLDFI